MVLSPTTARVIRSRGRFCFFEPAARSRGKFYDRDIRARSLTIMIQPGQPLPDATLYEFFEVEKDGCALGPNAFSVQHLAEGKTIVIFGLPGAFTPTCSARHVPGYLAHFDALRAKGVDEIWCVSVNDAFVMGAWARAQGTDDKIRMLGDGSAEFTSKLGLEQDLSKRGMGVRTVGALLDWGREMGAEAACLQVVDDNRPARALYERLGFTRDLYHYHYRHAPVVPG